jgi:hypothetical protein
MKTKDLGISTDFLVIIFILIIILSIIILTGVGLEINKGVLDGEYTLKIAILSILLIIILIFCTTTLIGEKINQSGLYCIPFVLMIVLIGIIVSLIENIPRSFAIYLMVIGIIFLLECCCYLSRMCMLVDKKVKYI